MGAFKSAGLVSLGLSFNSTKITKLLWALAWGLETTKGGLSVLSEDTKGPVVRQARLKYCQCQSDLSRSVCWCTHAKKKCAQLLAFQRGNSLFNKTNIWAGLYERGVKGAYPLWAASVEFNSFNTDGLLPQQGGHMCAEAAFHPSDWLRPAKATSPSHGPPQQPYSGSQSGHVWRQMESESVSGLPEMSLTSAAHKESGHRRSGITRWKKRGRKKKRGVSKKPSSTFTSLTQRWERAEQRARKAKETGQVVQGGMKLKQCGLDADVFFFPFFFKTLT